MGTILVTGINPEPWQAKKISLGYKGGKPYPIATTPPQQAAYQAALAENIEQAYPGLPMFPRGTPLRIRFAFWRQLEHYVTPTGRNHTRHPVDVTNLQKSTEDALQGIFMQNDIDVKEVSSVIINQDPNTTPAVLIIGAPYRGHKWDWDAIRSSIEARPIAPSPPGNVWYLPSEGFM